MKTSSELLTDAMRAKGIEGPSALASEVARRLPDGVNGPTRQACAGWLANGGIDAYWHHPLTLALPTLNLEELARALSMQSGGW